MKIKVIIKQGARRVARALKVRRKAAYKVHRVLGVALGLWLALVALTGALLMFRAELDWLTTPALRVPAALTRQPVWRPERMLTGVVAYAPEATVLRMDRPATARSASLVRITEGPHLSELMVHPRTGAVLGARDLGGDHHSPADWVRQLHVRVLLGAWGRALVGLLGVLWLVALFTGWWVHGRRGSRASRPRPSRPAPPRSGRKPRRAGAWRARLHARLAWATLPYALLMGVSGAWLGLETLPYLLSRVGAVETAPATLEPASVNPRDRAPLLRAGDLAHVDAAAARASPGAHVATLFPPERVGQTWLAALSHTSPLAPPGSVELDLAGATTPARLYAPRGVHLLSGALEALHVGSFAAHTGLLAWPLRLLWALLGLTPLVVALAGLYGTYRRHRVRAAKRQPTPLSPLPLQEPS